MHWIRLGFGEASLNQWRTKILPSAAQYCPCYGGGSGPRLAEAAGHRSQQASSHLLWLVTVHPENPESLGQPVNGPTMLIQRSLAELDGVAVCDAGRCGWGGVHGSQSG